MLKGKLGFEKKLSVKAQLGFEKAKQYFHPLEIIKTSPVDRTIECKAIRY